MIDDADGRFEFHREHRRTARKAHRCGECFRTISPGEAYAYTCGLFDGRFDVYRQCAHCAAAASLLVQHCRGFLYGGVAEDLESHFGQFVPWRYQAGRYAASIRRKWRRFRGEGLMPVPREATP